MLRPEAEATDSFLAMLDLDMAFTEASFEGGQGEQTVSSNPANRAAEFETLLATERRQMLMAVAGDPECSNLIINESSLICQLLPFAILNRHRSGAHTGAARQAALA